MELKELVAQIRKAAMKMNMEFNELVEWLIRENDNTLPWEE